MKYDPEMTDVLEALKLGIDGADLQILLDHREPKEWKQYACTATSVVMDHMEELKDPRVMALFKRIIDQELLWSKGYTAGAMAVYMQSQLSKYYTYEQLETIEENDALYERTYPDITYASEILLGAPFGVTNVIDYAATMGDPTTEETQAWLRLQQRQKRPVRGDEER
ncbi:MAG: hypothetical protein IKP28_05395 [Clostridia bacterium]|nr:hypothetical protein [Clostridia bacterium]